MALSVEEREQFLAEPHIGALSVIERPDRAPLTVPIWYQYTSGGELWVLTAPDARKTRAIDVAGRFSLMVQRTEPTVRYVSVEGPVTRTAGALAIRRTGSDLIPRSPTRRSSTGSRQRPWQGSGGVGRMATGRADPTATGATQRELTMGPDETAPADKTAPMTVATTRPRTTVATFITSTPSHQTNHATTLRRAAVPVVPRDAELCAPASTSRRMCAAVRTWPLTVTAI
jgi:hypothetical protein